MGKLRAGTEEDCSHPREHSHPWKVDPRHPREASSCERAARNAEGTKGGTAAEADTVGVWREAESFAEDAKMNPSNCLMETLVLRENQEGIRIRRSPGDYAEHLPWVLEHVFLQTLCGPGNDEQGRCPTAMCEETTADA
jgi:hypothetical protein